MKTLKIQIVVDATALCPDGQPPSTIGRQAHEWIESLVDEDTAPAGMTEFEIMTNAWPADEVEPALRAVVKARETLLSAFHGLEAVQNTEAITELERARHCLWMCGQVESYLGAGEREKAMRWLGFVQGTLWILGLRGIDAMREDVRAV